MNRFYGFFGANGAAVAMDIQDDKLTFALAFCNKRDSFEKKTARAILDGRLNARLDPERSKTVKHTYTITYAGDFPKRDVMNKVMDELRCLPKTRDWEEVQHRLENIQEDLIAGPDLCCGACLESIK